MSVTTAQQPSASPAVIPTSAPNTPPADDDRRRPSPDQGTGEADDQPESIDDRALREAMEALAAEEAGGAPAATEGAPAPTPAPGSPAPAQPQVGPQPMVPAARLREVSQKLREERDARLYAEGALAARTAAPPGGAAPASAPQQPVNPVAEAENQITALHAQIVALAEKFDNGEITLSQYEQQRFGLNNQIQGIRERALASYVETRIPPPQPEVLGIADQQYLDNLIGELEAKHPWSKILNDQEIAWIRDVAVAELTGRGIAIPPGARGAALIYQNVAQLCDVYGPRFYPDYKPPAVTTPAPKPPGTVAAVPPTPPSKAANDLRLSQAAAKLALAGAHPPNVNNLGATGTGTGEITLEQVETMTTDELAALPKATLDRLFSQR